MLWNKSNHNIGGLHNLSEANLLVAFVKLDIVSTHEDVAHDDERADGSRKILSHECEQALIFIHKLVVIAGQGVGVAANDEVNAGSGCVAVNGVLPVERRNDGQLLGTHGLCKALHLIS